MPIKFKSQVSGDLLMLQAHAQALLAAIGKGDDSVQGILQPADMATALSALRALSDDVPAAAEGEPDEAGSAQPAFQDEPVSLRKRAWPLIKMIEEAQAAGKPIVWGV